MEDFAIVDDIFKTNFFLYDLDIVDGSLIGELARIVGKHCNTVRLFRYNSHIWHVSIINAPFKAYRCSSCDHFIKTVQLLVRHLTTGKKRVEHVFLKKLNQLRETLFDKLDSVNIPNSDDQKFLENTAVFDFCLNLCAGRPIPLYPNYNLNRPARSNVCINFVQLD